MFIMEYKPFLSITKYVHTTLTLIALLFLKLLFVKAMDTIFKKTGETEVYQDNAVENLSKKFEAANTKLSQLKQLKFELDLENTKLMQSVEFMKKKINDFKPELREMDVKFLEDEHQALSGDKVELTEYVQSLQFQIVKLKGISHTINCCCGEEYKIEMNCSA